MCPVFGEQTIDLVDPFLRNRSAYTPSGIVYVSITPRNQMDMAVVDCLARRSTVVYADVEARYLLIFFYHGCAKLLKEQVAGVDLGAS